MPRRVGDVIAPSALTASTRPPAVTSCVAVARVPAWNTMTPSTRRGVVEPVDHVTGPRRRRVALAREHDGDARVVGELDRRAAARPPAAARHSSPRSVREARQHDLALGVAEAHVVLEHLRPVGREHQARVEHAAVLDAHVRRARATSGAPRVAITVLDQRRRRRSARASTRPSRRCSDPVSPSPMRLKSCAGASGTRAVGVAVAHARAATARGPRSPSSITSVRPASPNAAPER